MLCLHRQRMAASRLKKSVQVYSRKNRMPCDMSMFEMEDEQKELEQKALNKQQATGNIDTESSGNTFALPPPAAERLISALGFSSEFQSGNLALATRIGDTEYDLKVLEDYNTAGHTQWFYFGVSGMQPGVKYTFNILNFQKPSSLFNQGMQPLVYSETRLQKENVGWYRTGGSICYYKNGTGGSLGHALTLTIEFPYANDEAYLAYFYPYTLDDLKMDMANWVEATPDCKMEVLCDTFGGLAVPLLQISSGDADSVSEKSVIALSARVHPGESNGSWMMKGALDFLVSSDPTACALRDRYNFVVAPMVNIDGVILGNYRSSMAGLDLNRQWQKPAARITPEIFYWKRRLGTIRRKIKFCCDLHGHSRKTDAFFYGCSNLGHEDEKIFPYLLSQANPSVSFLKSRFGVQKSKKGTGRVVGWRELGITNCFTLEATFAGFTDGVHSGKQCTTAALEEVGRTLISTLSEWTDTMGSGDKKQETMTRIKTLLRKDENDDGVPVTDGSDVNDDSAGSDDDPTAGNFDMQQLAQRWAVALQSPEAVRSSTPPPPPPTIRTTKSKSTKRSKSQASKKSPKSPKRPQRGHTSLGNAVVDGPKAKSTNYTDTHQTYLQKLSAKAAGATSVLNANATATLTMVNSVGWSLNPGSASELAETATVDSAARLQVDNLLTVPPRSTKMNEQARKWGYKVELGERRFLPEIFRSTSDGRLPSAQLAAPLADRLTTAMCLHRTRASTSRASTPLTPPLRDETPPG